MPDGPWWEHLEEAFHRRPEGFQLSLRDRAQVQTTALSDVLVRTAGAVAVGGLAMPLGFHPLRLRQDFKDADLYGSMAKTHDPTQFFRTPPKNVKVEVKRTRFVPRFRPDDGACEDLRFESPYRSVNPRLRKRYTANKGNRIAHARLWRHHDGPRPTIIAIHGFSADLYQLNEWFFALPWFYKLGCDVALFTLPFHGRRQSRLSPFSGHGFFAGGVSHINEAFGQAVFDFRIFLDWFERERGVRSVGVTGVSLGGFTSALLAAVEPRLRFAIPNVPLASLPDLVMEWEPLGTALRLGLAATTRTLKDARYMCAVTSPLTYPPVLDKDRLFIIGGVGDRLVPPKHSRLLWDHWDRCRIHWFPGSHAIHLDRGAYLRQMRVFFDRIGFMHEGL